MKDVARAYRFSVLEEPIEPRKLIPKADRFGYIVGILVFCLTLFFYVTPEIINFGTEQTIIDTCWIPKDATVSIDEKAWRDHVSEMQEGLGRADFTFEHYQKLLADDKDQTVLLTRDHIYYVAKSGKMILRSHKSLSYPKKGVIEEVTHGGGNQIIWKVKYTAWSMLWSTAKGLFFGVVLGAVSFWFSGFIYFLITLKFSSLRARYEAT